MSTQKDQIDNLLSTKQQHFSIGIKKRTYRTTNGSMALFVTGIYNRTFVYNKPHFDTEKIVMPKRKHRNIIAVFNIFRVYKWI